MDISLVIFDFDGTLGDTRRTIVATVQQTLQELGLPVATEEAIVATIGLPLRECYRHYVQTLDCAGLDACEEVHHRLFDINRKACKPVLFPYVEEVVRGLRGKGIRTTIASSRTSSSLCELLSDLGIADCFDYVLGAEDVTRAKPHPEPVLQTLRKMKAEASRTLVVGDMAVDILMGAGAGCKTCGVTYGNGSAEELKKAGADFVVDDMTTLMDLFEKCK